MKSFAYEDFTLLVDGKTAFPAILSCIEKAREKILVNMFIWRDDAIGNHMAEAICAAADRGVSVTLSVDRYGVVLEKSEESRRSFFHKSQTPSERLKSRALSIFYPMKGAPKRAKDQTSPLYERIVHHPNITLDVNSFKADHSKYYIIDDEILFLGGINVEDKENGADMQGRVYRDYMVKIEGRAHVEAFLEKLRTGADVAKGYSFGINRKMLGLFEMEERYLSLIREARESLEIHMAYFSPLPRFLDAITKAYERGVAVTVVIPEHANYQSDSNYKTVKRLMKRTNNGIALYLTPKMAHTKLIANENWISFGSTNVTKKAFGQLDELNLFVEGKENPLADAIRADLEGERTRAARVLSDKSLRYRPIMAWLEGFLV